MKGDYRLTLIGKEAHEIQRMVRDYGMEDRVHMTGVIPRDTLFKMLLEADCYVSTSTIEGLPVSVLEAMTVGLPTIVSEIPPHVEIQKKCREVVTLPFDRARWVAEIEKVIGEDEKVLRARGEKGREAVIRSFSLESMHKQYDAQYEKIAGTDGQ